MTVLQVEEDVAESCRSEAGGGQRSGRLAPLFASKWLHQTIKPSRRVNNNVNDSALAHEPFHLLARAPRVSTNFNHLA